MHSKFKSSKLPANFRHFWRKFSFMLVIPVIFLSLANCNTETPSTLPVDSASIPNTPVQAKSQPKLQKVSDNHVSKHAKPCEKKSLSIVVNISKQELYLYCNYQGKKKKVKIYPVSTSKYGIGSEAGSNKTPLGLHRIEKKIGNGAPIYTIFKARRNTGRSAKAILNDPGAGDLVTTRIMWLKGLEPGKNSGRGVDSFRRYIYIHGTGEENKIGKRASHGCIRMYNKDVIDLYNRVSEGTKVLIIK